MKLTHSPFVEVRTSRLVKLRVMLEWSGAGQDDEPAPSTDLPHVTDSHFAVMIAVLADYLTTEKSSVELQTAAVVCTGIWRNRSYSFSFIHHK